MTNLVTLTIDGLQVEVPEGTLVVDAAKKIGIDIPVFCYHPKMEPVGMCRMCLVELGNPVIDRSTGKPVLEEDGTPKIQFSPKLETACTTPVSQGMVVIGASDRVKEAREDVLEFLLTSHPLDCPICDKGGECPLQNLTMEFGPSRSRFAFSDKKHMEKHVPLGDLIFLDRERCIQCARCVRFQDLIADDPVIGFYNRGRSLEIETHSEPGFNSYWSGNTTDICPVGALTTADFRFGARPWELQTAASICTHCPVGCNLTLNIRREAVSGGNTVVKRIMPRQNEDVNELWICDKGRFGYHFASNAPLHDDHKRIIEPLIRQEGKLVATSWDNALQIASEKLRTSGNNLFTLAGGRLSNEDFYNLGTLTDKLGGKKALYSTMGGGENTRNFGLPEGSTLSDIGEGDVVLVVGSDLEEEAPLWWLRVKQAAQRGANLIVLNTRETKLNRHANHFIKVDFGTATALIVAMTSIIKQAPKQRQNLTESIQNFLNDQSVQKAAKEFAQAKNAMIFYGSDGMGLRETEALSQACVNMLVESKHVGKPNNGLIGVWQHANDQGAWEIGWKPSRHLEDDIQNAEVLYIIAADPEGDDPAFHPAFGGDKFVIVQELFLTQTARLADIVLPAQSWIEREGSYTSGERRVQRFYPALSATTVPPKQESSPGTRHSPVLLSLKPELEGPQADYSIPAFIAERLGIDGLVTSSASRVFDQLASKMPVFKDLDYQKLAETHEQNPIIGRDDLYYGGTGYANRQGLGVQLPLASEEIIPESPVIKDATLPKLGMMAFPITRLYDQGTTLAHSKLLKNRIGESYVIVNAYDAGRIKVDDGDMVRIRFSETGTTVAVKAMISEELPERVLLIPRSFGIPINSPAIVELKREE